MKKILTIAAVLIAFGTFAAEAGQPSCYQRGFGGTMYSYGPPSWYRIAPATPVESAPIPSEGQYRSFSYEPGPQTPTGAEVFPAPGPVVPLRAASPPPRRSGGPSYYSAGSKMRGRYGR